MVPHNPEINSVCGFKFERRRIEMDPRPTFETKRQNSSSFDSGRPIFADSRPGNHRATFVGESGRQKGE